MHAQVIGHHIDRHDAAGCNQRLQNMANDEDDGRHLSNIVLQGSNLLRTTCFTSSKSHNECNLAKVSVALSQCKMDYTAKLMAK